MDRVQNDRLLRALRHEPVDATPIWIMRQAGRYLPEYRAVRAKAGDFLTLMRTPELAAEVTVQPLRRFDLDAAIIFSDILTIPDALGLGLHFVEGEGPRFHTPLRTPADIDNLPKIDVNGQLGYVADALRQTRQALAGSVPLIGFAGSPWTLATYMVEGGGSKEFRHIKGLLYSDPAALHRLLDLLARAVSDYLLMQIEAGAQALMIFDTWGGTLTPSAYQAFSLAYMSRIVETLNHHKPEVPVTLFTKNGGQWLEQIAASGCQGVGLDWTVELADARQRIGNRVALQGNMDPGVLFGSPQQVVAEATRLVKAFGPHNGHIFNLGHGINQHVDPANVALLVDTVHKQSQLLKKTWKKD
ncbi:MAG: uroporphyrinogen decarboxylase [Gammaproteobacteria bacterium]|nr:uroporphyrinogen decarboxylase [Gammaproteobacteria bacterium]